jgi:hypothetical protein
MNAKKVAGDKSTAGVGSLPKRDAYQDVKRACNRFLRERIARGEMRDWTGLMNKENRRPHTQG